MEFSNSKSGDYLVVKVSGRLDAVTNTEFDAACAQWLEQGEDRVVVDLGGLEYVSSAGLRSVLAAAKKIKARQGTLAFCGLTGMVAEVFSVSGFAAMLPIYQTVDEAVGG